MITLGKILRQRWNASIVVPVSSDLEQATHIVQGIGRGAQILPRGNLRDLADAIACADLVVAADTGAARIAAALDVPTITLFGSAWYGRYGQPSPHINLQGYPECPDGFLLTLSDALVTTNVDAEKVIQARLPKLSQRVYSIAIAPNVEVAPIERNTARQILREKCNWNQRSLVIAFFGFLHPVKGLETLLPAFKKC